METFSFSLKFSIRLPKNDIADFMIKNQQYKYKNIFLNLQKVINHCTNVACHEKNGCTGNQCVKMDEMQPEYMSCNSRNFWGIFKVNDGSFLELNFNFPKHSFKFLDDVPSALITTGITSTATLHSFFKFMIFVNYFQFLWRLRFYHMDQ